MGRGRLRYAIVLVCALVLVAVTGSGCDLLRKAPDEGAGAVTDAGTSKGDANGESAASGDEIPPGREFAEGGGGPKSYTFREEWRRSLVAAREWRDDAYLIAAVGRFVNDDGVPSEWRLSFIDSQKPDALLLVTVDPWGKVTGTRELTGTGVTSNVSKYDKPMPFDVIDSDEAVRIGRETIGAAYDLGKTKDPSLALGYSVIDGSGPNWTYTVFYTSSADYVSAQIDALTGEAKLVK